DLRHLTPRPGIQLFDSHDRHVRSALGGEIVVKLSREEHESRYRVSRLRRDRIVDRRSELAAHQLAESRCRFWQPQQTLRLHQNQRTALDQRRLTSQNVKVLRRCRWIGDTLISFGTELEKSLEARARMLGPLPLVPVWKQEHHR